MESKDLLALKKGATLLITSGDKTVTVVLQDRPTLAPVGKPGIHRVRLYVYDPSRMPNYAFRPEMDAASIAHDKRALREISGDKVLEIVTGAS